MKVTFTIIGIAVACLLSVNLCSAQTPAFPTLLPLHSKITVDGNIKDWGDSLSYYNKEYKISYAIANDKENLYLAVRIKDRSEQIRVLHAGLNFGIDTRGKKKNSFLLTFPLSVIPVAADLNFRGLNMGPVKQPDRDLMAFQRSGPLRGIKLDGFKDTPSEVIRPDLNTTGIESAIDYDEQGYLICEAIIPLKLLHVDDLYKNEWAFNLTVNAIPKPTAEYTPDNSDAGGGRGSRGGGGGGSRGGGNSRGGGSGAGNSATGGGGDGPGALFNTDGFWVKYYLTR